MLKKFFHYFKSRPIKTSPNDQLSVVISLQNNYNIDIELKYPNLENYSVENMTSLAEKYAELLIYINSNVLKHKLLENIKERSYRSEDLKQKLFFDNVLSFHDIVKQEIKKQTNTTGPLVSPMSVFATK